MKAKILAAAIVLTLIMTACSQGNQAAAPSGEPAAETPVTSADDAAGENAEASAEETAPEPEATATDGPDVIEFMIGEQFSAPVTNDLAIIQELERRTNTILNITNVAQADLEVKVQTALASDSPPDVVAFFNYDNAAIYAKNGLFLPMDEYLDKYPNITKWWDMFPSIKKNTHFDDGRLYALPKIDTRVFLVHLTINQDWLDNVGMTNPENLDEFYETLKAFKEAYPDGTPYGVGQYVGAYGIINPILYAYDVQRGFINYHDDIYTYGYYTRSESLREGLRYLSQLYSENLIEPQLFSITEDEISKKISNNEVGVFTSWEIFENYGPGGSFGTNYVPLAALKGPDGKARDRGTAPTGVPFYVTSGSKNPEAVMRLFDFIYGDEGVELLNWGIEGDTFVFENGEYVFTDKVLQHELGPGTGRYALGINTPHFPCVALKETEYAAVMPLTQVRETLLTPDIKYPDAPVLTGTDEENAVFSRIMADLNTYVNESIPMFIMGDWNTDGDFDAFITQLKDMGIEEAIEIKDAQFARWNSR